MIKAPKTNLDGYAVTMKTIKDRLNPSSSPEAWLAHRIGVTRQAVYNWAKQDGIPANHVPEVAILTGLDPTTIRPGLIRPGLLYQHIPENLFNEIARQARSLRISFGEHLIAIIRRGLRK